jgi:hypothetical protein
MDIRLPQHDGQSIYGDRVTLTSDGTLSINKFDGITTITKAQARQIADMLVAWAISGVAR